MCRDTYVYVTQGFQGSYHAFRYGEEPEIKRQLYVYAQISNEIVWFGISGVTVSMSVNQFLPGNPPGGGNDLYWTV